MEPSAEQPPRPITPIIGRQAVTISRDPDITVWVYSVKDTGGCRTLTKFQIQRDALTSQSEYFTSTLRFNSQNGRDPYNVMLKDDDTGAMRVWFVYLQAYFDRVQADQGDERPSKRVKMVDKYATVDEEALFDRTGVYDSDIARIWHIIIAADKYQLEARILAGFFDIWYRNNVHIMELTSDFARQVALPCYMFNHAVGFAEVTRWLAYNFSGHITEKRPEAFKWEHMRFTPPDFVGPMNHARGALKTSIHRGIWDNIGILLERGSYACDCGLWATTAGHYFAALVKSRAYQLEKTFSRSSVNAILTDLKNFDMPSPAVGTTLCRLCAQDWKDHVARARVNTIKNFDGLCIDCMDRSRPSKRGDEDVDYWRQCESVNGRWDTHCRVRHDEPT